MPAQKHKPEEAIGKLREVEIVLRSVDELVDVEACDWFNVPF